MITIYTGSQWAAPLCVVTLAVKGQHLLCCCYAGTGSQGQTPLCVATLAVKKGSFTVSFAFSTPPLPRHNGILYSHNISTTLAILSSRGEKRKKEKITGLAKEVVGLWYILDHIFMLQLLQQGDLSNGCAGYTFWFPASHHRKGSVQDLQQLNKRRKPVSYTHLRAHETG